MAPARAAPFSVDGAPNPARRGGRRGPADRPLPRRHGEPALRPPWLAGAGAGRAPGRSSTTLAATASRTRHRPARVMDTRGWSPTWSGSSRLRWGRAAFVLAGHSMGAHTAIAYALRHPERLTGLVVIGPIYTGETRPDSLAYWDGLAAALEEGGVDGFVDYIDRNQAIDPAWRDSVLGFTRARMLLHRHPEALVEALHEVARSRPFESMDELEGIDVPALVVASARRRRSRPPLRGRRRLRGAPAAGPPDQREEGGIAACLAGRQALAAVSWLLRRGSIVVAVKFPSEGRCGGSSPSSRPSASASPPTSRSSTPAAARRPAWPGAAAARPSPTAPTRTSPGSTSRSSGSSATSASSSPPSSSATWPGSPASRWRSAASATAST